MILTKENYHSVEAKKEYMSASRYKDFCGSLGIIPCESRAMAMLRGDWVEQPTAAMIVSSYVDNHFSGTLDIFKAQHPDIFTAKNELKSPFKHANDIISRVERDPYFMKYMSGEKQVIMTAELFGMKWSIMIDSFIMDLAIVDLKIMADLNKSHWVKDYGHMSFVSYYGYLEQSAIYQAVVEKNIGKLLPFFIAAASKEDCPNLEIIGFNQEDFTDIMTLIERNCIRVKNLRDGELEPDKCEQCDWCRTTKVLTKPVHFSELVLGI